MKRIGLFGLAASVALVAATVLAGAGHGEVSADVDAPRFTATGELVFPDDYRRWVFLTSGHGMNYNEQAAGASDPPFDNVFVNPTAYAAFQKTGHWPDGTILVLEIRGASSKGSINRHGAFQSGAPMAVEVHVHDSKRFKDGWGFFGFDGRKPASMIAYSANCYSCHQAHAAVDTTFVQFYPTLLPLATDKGTLSPAYRAEEAKAP